MEVSELPHMDALQRRLDVLVSCLQGPILMMHGFKVICFLLSNETVCADF